MPYSDIIIDRDGNKIVQPVFHADGAVAGTVGIVKL
jgi:hypothetical protein